MAVDDECVHHGFVPRCDEDQPTALPAAGEVVKEGGPVPDRAGGVDCFDALDVAPRDLGEGNLDAEFLDTRGGGAEVGQLNGAACS